MYTEHPQSTHTVIVYTPLLHHTWMDVEHLTTWNCVRLSTLCRGNTCWCWVCCIVGSSLSTLLWEILSSHYTLTVIWLPKLMYAGGPVAYCTPHCCHVKRKYLHQGMTILPVQKPNACAQLQFLRKRELQQFLVSNDKSAVKCNYALNYWKRTPPFCSVASIRLVDTSADSSLSYPEIISEVWIK